MLDFLILVGFLLVAIWISKSRGRSARHPYFKPPNTLQRLAIAWKSGIPDFLLELARAWVRWVSEGSRIGKVLAIRFGFVAIILPPLMFGPDNIFAWIASAMAAISLLLLVFVKL